MTKRVAVALGLLLVIGAGLVVWMRTPPPEPVYEGKRLSQWLEDHLPRSGVNPPYNSPGWQKADEALRKIGTNGLPTLVRMIGAKDSRLKIKLVDLGRKTRMVSIPYRYAVQLNEEAEYAFEVLGTNAAAAVPALIEVYETNVSPSSQRCAALALGHIGRPAQAALPTLLRNFTHTNGEVRFYAVSAVYHIGGDPEIIVPAMITRLKDPKIEVRWNAMTALSNYGRRARAAVPALLEALSDEGKVGSDPIRKQVEVALWRIAPEKTGKALVVEAATPIIAGGRTTQALDYEYKGQRRTVIKGGTPVPCGAQFWDSEPRAPIALYRGKGKASGEDHFLGRFEVMEVPPPPTNVNIQVMCVIVDQQVVLCARDSAREMFLPIRRIEDAGAK